jgi:peptidoglycan/xylan/chitin deacetylase (PgdA/CDA1 family)
VPNKLALTFDDGPHGIWTAKVLDALAGHDARATFFMVAPLALATPEIVARIKREGHTIGVHCGEHVRHSEGDENWAAHDIDGALECLSSLGIEPTLWRTPWGDRAPWTDSLAADRGLSLVDWNADTHDWRGDSAAEMFGAIAPDLQDGAIVLAHDGLGPGALRSGCKETVELVNSLLERVPLLGLEVAGLDRTGRPA